MAIILKNITLLSGEPVTVGADVNVRLDLEALPADTPFRSGVVKLWCEAAYSVTPSHVSVSIAGGEPTAQVTTQIRIAGAPGLARLRVIAASDEVHSFFVDVQ